MVARRQVLAAGAVGAAMLVSPGSARASSPGGARAAAVPRTVRAAESEPPPLLEPATIDKWVTGLPIPAVMPPLTGAEQGDIDEYLIGVRQFRQQILPPNLPRTAVWGYGSPAQEGTFNYPGWSIEAKVNRPVRVTWVNELVDGQGRFRPHLLPVDPTLHWANPPGGEQGRDFHSEFSSAPEPYSGPVPIVSHLHGAHTGDESDGYPEAWYLPVASDIPDGYATIGSRYEEFREKFERERGAGNWGPGSATFYYPNDQAAAALWYHDHSLGLTRLNIYAGLTGYYFLRGGEHDLPDGVLPGPAPSLDDVGLRHYEIPLIVQDRTFNADGSLHYPARKTPTLDEGEPFEPDEDVPPIWIPNFFGDTIVVNGRTWPVFEVEPRRYRFRLLNACNGRYLLLKIVTNATARPGTPAVAFWQIGADGGFLPQPVRLERLQLAPAERADVIVDFTGLPAGTELYVINEGPDGHFGGGEPGTDFDPADPETTGQVLKLLVGELLGEDQSVSPELLTLPALPVLEEASVVRRMAIDMQMSAKLPDAGPVAHHLGKVTEDGKRIPLFWHDPIEDVPELGATEIWEFYNYTPDAHPIHLHLVQFQVLGRGRDGSEPPERTERGFKDVVVAYPGQITRVKARFDIPGRYVWHCHILEHEDNEMMLPFIVNDHPQGSVDAGDGRSTTPRISTAIQRRTLAGTGTGLLAAATVGGVVLARRQPAGSSAGAPVEPIGEPAEPPHRSRT